MKFFTRTFVLSFLLVSGITAQTPNPDLSGRWTGVADTTDEAGTRRQEKQTLEIRMENGKPTGYRVDKNGKTGLKLDVQQAGSKLRVYGYPHFQRGRPRRRQLD